VVQAPEGTLPGGYKASEWLGKAVKNLDGEDLGEVEDLVLTPMGSVHYVVLSHGGFLVFGEEELIVASGAAIVLAPNRGHLVLDVSKERMEEAPRLKKGQWPNLWDPEWSTVVGISCGLELRARVGWAERACARLKTRRSFG
jgi:sporulation protein YlmC with PRC-barrel domain